MKAKHLYLTVITKIIFGIILIYTSGIELNPDEAQYWTWSQALDLGYYSKPPGVAWQIFLGTKLFGNSLMGIRAASLVLGALLPLAMYRMASMAGANPSVAVWTGIVFAIAPLGFLSTLLATTDAGYILFWILAQGEVLMALKLGLRPNYLRVGGLMAIGALFKWTIFLFWPVLILLSLYYKKLQSKTLAKGIALSFLGLAPSIYWNIFHDFATFKHVGSSQTRGLSEGNPLEFVAAQMGLLSPVFFLLLMGAFFFLLKRRQHVPLPIRFCGHQALLFFACGTTLSVFSKMQGNWIAYSYPSAILLLCHCTYHFGKRSLLHIGWTTSTTISVFLLYLPLLQSTYIDLPYSINPLQSHMGWEKLPDILKEVDFDSEGEFLFAERYQMASLLSFYNENKKRAYFLPIMGARKNQFSYWPGLEDRTGDDGIFVYTEDEPKLSALNEKVLLQAIKPYFNTVQFLGRFPLFKVKDRTVKAAFAFRCKSYNGKRPKNSKIW